MTLRSCRAAWWVAAAAQGLDVGDDAADVFIGEVGAFEPARDAAFGEQPADPAGFGGDVGGVVALLGPAGAQDDVRASVGGAAERASVRADIPQAGRHDVRG